MGEGRDRAGWPALGRVEAAADLEGIALGRKEAVALGWVKTMAELGGGGARGSVEEELGVRVRCGRTP